jgi:aspartokinase
MAESHVLSGLIAKRSEMAGRVEKYQTEIDHLNGQLVHLDATIKLFDPSFNLASIRPKKPQERDTIFGHGESARLTLDAFREIGGKATTRQITEAIFAAKRVEYTPEMFESVQKRIQSHMKRNPSRYRELEKDMSGAPCWELIL